MTQPRFTALMTTLYFDIDTAKALLMRHGLQPHLLPPTQDMNLFWARASQQMANGLGPEDIMLNIVAETAKVYQGNREAQELLAEFTGARTEPARPISTEGPCPTLTLVGADLPTEFLNAVREQIGTDAPELLYTSRQQCAVSIPEPADANAVAKLRQELQELIQTYAPGVDLQVVYEKYQFRPYLLSELTVFGPDTTPYRLQSVPATATPGDISAAIVDQTAPMSGRRNAIRTVIDSESDDGDTDRLDPDKTLHENKVRDKGRLRVGVEAVAGNISPEQRMEAQLRMRAQVRRYAYGHPDFDILDYDNEDLPNRITFALDGPGLAPPENLNTFLAGAVGYSLNDFKAMDWDKLIPIKIHHHRFTMFLPAMFPVVAPYVAWDTPVFHPNIWRLPQPGVRPGTVCLGPLMDGYRPDLDFGYLCQLLIDIGTYRNYDIVEASTFPDPPAALWARTTTGQRIIQEIGGSPMRDEPPPEGGPRVAPPLWLRRLGDQPVRGSDD